MQGIVTRISQRTTPSEDHEYFSFYNDKKSLRKGSRYWANIGTDNHMYLRQAV